MTEAKEIPFEPFGDRVLVKRVDNVQESAGGIIIPQAAQEKSQRGQVLAMGHENVGLLKTGDTVLFGKYSGTEIELDGTECVILRLDEILGRLNG